MRQKHLGHLFLVLPLLMTTPAGHGDSSQLAMLDNTQSASGKHASRWDSLDDKRLALRSKAALIQDSDGNLIFDRSATKPMPIASITKLMTAMVVLDSGLPLDEKITITKADRDLIRLTGSRLKYGARLSRKDLITIALMASENRAAHALGRSFPGGISAFVAAMNQKAKSLGMRHSHFVDPVGLGEDNVASAHDLMLMLNAAAEYPLITHATSISSYQVRPYKKLGPLRYGNTNRLVKNQAWEVQLSKTGYIDESGRCLVMRAEVDGHQLDIVLLNSFGKLTPFGDSNRIRKWIKNGL